jgi:hypothetical protein
MGNPNTTELQLNRIRDLRSTDLSQLGNDPRPSRVKFTTRGTRLVQKLCSMKRALSRYEMCISRSCAIAYHR